MPVFLFIPAAGGAPVEEREMAPGDLTRLAKTVGGHVETFTAHIPEPVTLVVWDEAALAGAPRNARASQLAGTLLRGDVAVAGPARDGHWTDVPPAVRGRLCPPPGPAPVPATGPIVPGRPDEATAPTRRGRRPRPGQMVTVGGGCHELATSLSDNTITVRAETHPAAVPAVVLRLDAAWMHTIATSHLTADDTDLLIHALQSARDTLRRAALNGRATS